MLINAILHGTWIPADGSEGQPFFVWAERSAEQVRAHPGSPRIQRHPYAATTIEIAHLLDTYMPDSDWRSAERLTRIVLLPSTDRAPVMPGWLVEDDIPEPGEVGLVPWRVEGIGVSVLEVLDVLAALPLEQTQPRTQRGVGADLRYWGLVAKFALELLARQRYLPGLRAMDEGIHAVWQPVLDDPDDAARVATLARGMPPACRALLREGADTSEASLPPAEEVLLSFLEQLVDHAVRDWTRPANGSGVRTWDRLLSRTGTGLAETWWRALWSEKRLVEAPGNRADVGRFYQSWQSWTLRARPAADVAFRLCFRLEPPDTNDVGETTPNWTLHYFLQARDDPSLMVPARDVWHERGNVLNYLNRRFDRPQETLLAGLGMAARLCPAIQRSLRSECPEEATMSPQEAYTFLRETARLLEGTGFGVLVPPWWNKPDTRLRVRARLQAGGGIEGSGILSMDSLVAYDWELALGDEPLSREEFERLAALKTPLVRVRGRWVLLQPDQVEAAIAFWERQRAQNQLPLRDALGLMLGTQTEIDGLDVTEVKLDSVLQDLMEALTRGERLETLPPPPGFVGQLRPYQVRGYSWLAFLQRWGFGACLADDMGLGKTIQAIALLLHDADRQPDGQPSLVICPTSVVGNWQREVARFGPDLRVMVHHGAGRAEGAGFVAQTQQNDLVISTYGLVRRDIKDLTRVHWRNIILDEAQNIKNPLTKQARAVRQLLGSNRIALTGTPIENHLTELWSILSFLNPGYLGSNDSFRRKFALPIERYQDQTAAERLRTLVRPFVLRRLKTDPLVIQDLPDKFESKVYCNLTREQATLYEAVVRDAMEALRAVDHDGTPIQRRGIVLAMLTRLKQVCNHPTLYLGDGSETTGRSGKLNRLCEMLEEALAVGDRALIFTQFAQMGFLLQRHLRETFGQDVFLLHGGTPQKQRDRMLQAFQEQPDSPALFVLSLKAGGTGLNLMRANHVFHYDRWWNPAVENQATDRAYRIGQTRDVQVHKFICLGTLEERIDMLIESKSALAESVVGVGEESVTELSTDELYDLLALRREAVETS